MYDPNVDPAVSKYIVKYSYFFPLMLLFGLWILVYLISGFALDKLSKGRWSQQNLYVEEKLNRFILLTIVIAIIIGYFLWLVMDKIPSL